MLSPDDPRHGTDNGYSNLGCRCRDCTNAANAKGAKQQAARKGTLTSDDERHGTYNGYRNYGCRCPECKNARAVYADGYNERRATRADKVLSRKKLTDRPSSG